MLIAQLPAKPDYLRVKLRRRIQRLGAVTLKGGVYALPDREDTAEDFVWLRTELLADGADAVICASSIVAGTSDAELEALFRSARDDDYRAMADEARALAESRSRDDAVRALPKLRRRLDEIDHIDFFAAPARADAQRAIDRLAELATGRSANVESAKPSGDAADAPHGRTWVTREGIFVDRIASAWLIRRFIDRSATFRFVAPRGYTPLMFLAMASTDDPEMTQALIKYGADPKMQAPDVTDALFYARQKGNTKSVEILSTYTSQKQ
jgi:hypothetical protein